MRKEALHPLSVPRKEEGRMLDCMSTSSFLCFRADVAVCSGANGLDVQNLFWKLCSRKGTLPFTSLVPRYCRREVRHSFPSLPRAEPRAAYVTAFLWGILGRVMDLRRHRLPSLLEHQLGGEGRRRRHVRENAKKRTTNYLLRYCVPFASLSCRH